MALKIIWILYFMSVYYSSTFSQIPSLKYPKGSLFIIGGGSRTGKMISTLLETAHLSKKDYIVILPMASSEPDSSFLYIKAELEKACSNTIANLNFSVDKIKNQLWVDSLLHAKLIFISGGDQSRFMNLVLHTTLYTAIRNAYNSGSTIAGTSAGAAVMSRYMITGNHLLGDTTFSETFANLLSGNIEFKEGLGLLTSVIIDQHFIARSRYNRLLSALAAFPKFTCIGIDEATAIIVHQKKIKVVGESQVVKLSDPKGLQIIKNGLIKFKNVDLAVYTDGDSFDIK